MTYITIILGKKRFCDSLLKSVFKGKIKLQHEKRWPLWSIKNFFSKAQHIWMERVTFHYVPSFFRKIDQIPTEKMNFKTIIFTNSLRKPS
jgi:hypothetical protein